MPSIQIAIDCADPHALADFYAEALGYVQHIDEDFVRGMVEAGHASEDDVTTYRGKLVWREGAAAHDPDGERPRLYFQMVPEPKTVKNRVHMDIRTGADLDEEVARLEALGATRLWEGRQGSHSWVTMADPEGNEFCVS